MQSQCLQKSLFEGSGLLQASFFDNDGLLSLLGLSLLSDVLSSDFLPDILSDLLPDLLTGLLTDPLSDLRGLSPDLLDSRLPFCSLADPWLLLINFTFES